MDGQVPFVDIKVASPKREWAKEFRPSDLVDNPNIWWCMYVRVSGQASANQVHLLHSCGIQQFMV